MASSNRRSGAHRPPGYPREFERVITLADGREVRVRPVVPGDASALQHAIRTADEATLRGRFLGGAPPTSWSTIRRLVEVDYESRFALVAFGDGRGVAIARYEPLPEQPGVAEVAVAVDPAWRRVGLATVLVRLLAEAAVSRGITQFVVTYFAQNVDVAAIVSDTGLTHMPQLHAGIVEDALPLPDRVDAMTFAPSDPVGTSRGWTSV